MFQGDHRWSDSQVCRMANEAGLRSLGRWCVAGEVDRGSWCVPGNNPLDKWILSHPFASFPSGIEPGPNHESGAGPAVRWDRHKRPWNFPCGSSRILATGWRGEPSLGSHLVPLVHLSSCVGFYFIFSLPHSYRRGKRLGARHDYQTLAWALYKERPRPRLTPEFAFWFLFFLNYFSPSFPLPPTCNFLSIFLCDDFRAPGDCPRA